MRPSSSSDAKSKMPASASKKSPPSHGAPANPPAPLPRAKKASSNPKSPPAGHSSSNQGKRRQTKDLCKAVGNHGRQIDSLNKKVDQLTEALLNNHGPDRNKSGTPGFNLNLTYPSTGRVSSPHSTPPLPPPSRSVPVQPRAMPSLPRGAPPPPPSHHVLNPDPK